MSLQGSPIGLMVISVLIIAGGIGFATLEESWNYVRRLGQGKFIRLSLNTQMILWFTALLLIVPIPIFAGFEWHRTLNGLSPVDKISNACFMSVTSRTAGFNSIDYGEACNSTNFLTILLMTIGGAPGSTAGGMKVTTFALIVLLARTRFHGDDHAVFLNRSIPAETTQRAIGLAVLCFIVMTTGVFALSITEHQVNHRGDFLADVFESVSAFNTVGLSMNRTSTLTDGGRWILILLMFVGRVGPMMVIAAMAVGRSRRPHFRFAYEDVVVG